MQEQQQSLLDLFYGFLGGEFVRIRPYNIIGLPILIGGAVLYFVGRKRAKS
jgi:hypothetical protein